MADEALKAKVDMIHHDLTALRDRDEEHDQLLNRTTSMLDEHAKSIAAIPHIKSDVDHLRSQHKEIFEQSMQHGKMLLEHAKLHTQHADAIAAARDQARHATQSSSDLAREWRDAAVAIDRHVKGVAEAQSDKLDTLIAAKDLQTKALQQIASHAGSPKLAAFVAAGAVIGGLIAGLLHQLLK